ncbi:hypothetical protein [Streptosporangium sp. NPDC051022]|uniref:hypothetical protein n=1 Tax=Streptosporangium sp. NPDC051022 TaxID=3155752 RepID=UPI0034254381
MLRVEVEPGGTVVTVRAVAPPEDVRMEHRVTASVTGTVIRANVTAGPRAEAGAVPAVIKECA